MKPSDFISLPVGSVLKNAEYETAARNIMVVLARTGDTWRELSWEHYSEHRVKDGHFAPWKEDNFFKKALPYTVSEEKARSFSPCWKKV